MPVERTVGGTSLIDVLDRVLDKGIVIDAWVRVSLVGIDLLTVAARAGAGAIDTYLQYSERGGQAAPTSGTRRRWDRCRPCPARRSRRARRRSCWPRTPPSAPNSRRRWPAR